LGETLQQITDYAIIPSLKKFLATSFSERANAKVGPSITMLIREKFFDLDLYYSLSSAADNDISISNFTIC
jgi:hypothetical protein